MTKDHVPTQNARLRVSDLVMAGTPKYIIAEIIGIDDETLDKHYAKEIKTSKSLAIERIAKTVYQQAVDGDSKAQALYLKTQGASQGWVEKQIIETHSHDNQELKDKIAALEAQHEKEA
jgi:hypothetical protein